MTEKNASVTITEIQDELGCVRNDLAAVADILTFMKYDEGADMETIGKFLSQVILHKKEQIKDFIECLGQIKQKI